MFSCRLLSLFALSFRATANAALGRQDNQVGLGLNGVSFPQDSYQFGVVGIDSTNDSSMRCLKTPRLLAETYGYELGIDV